MIVHISQQDTKGKSSFLASMTTTIPDKIRSDISALNPTKKERYFRAINTHQQSPRFKIARKRIERFWMLEWTHCKDQGRDSVEL